MPVIKLKTERITLRVTPKDKVRIANLTKKLEMDASTVIRTAVKNFAEFHGVK